MFHELSVYNHVVGLHTRVLVLNVLVPKSIVVVKVVHWLNVSNFLGNCLDFVNLSVGLAIKVCHATFNFWFDLELCDCHLLLQNSLAFLSAFIGLDTCYHLLSN